MSMELLLLAVRDRLRSALGYSAEQCDVRPDGQPPAACGEVFLAVHPAGIRQNDAGAHVLDEEYDVGATLTMREGWLPVDRLGPESVAKASTGLYARIQAVRATLHMDYVSMNAANAAIGAGENGFIEPFKEGGIGAAEPKYSDWFSGANPTDEPEAAPAGHTLQLTMRGARRVQALEEVS